MQERNKGYTLVELLVAIFIATVIIAAVFRLLSRVSLSYEEGRNLSERMTNLHIAAHLITEDIRTAGLGISGNPIEVTCDGSCVITLKGCFYEAAYLIQEASSGSSEIRINDASDFDVGDTVLIGENEVRTVTGVGSNYLTLNATLSEDYPQGAKVRLVTEVQYYVSGGVLYKKVDDGSPQPILEDVESLRISADNNTYTVTINLSGGLSLTTKASKRI